MRFRFGSEGIFVFACGLGAIGETVDHRKLKNIETYLDGILYWPIRFVLML